MLLGGAAPQYPLLLLSLLIQTCQQTWSATFHSFLRLQQGDWLLQPLHLLSLKALQEWQTPMLRQIFQKLLLDLLYFHLLLPDLKALQQPQSQSLLVSENLQKLLWEYSSFLMISQLVVARASRWWSWVSVGAAPATALIWREISVKTPPGMELR